MRRITTHEMILSSVARYSRRLQSKSSHLQPIPNARLFTLEFDVDIALDQADIMSNLIEEEISLSDMMTMLKLRCGKFSLVEEKIFPGARRRNSCTC
jgi:trk system potassium uptake protein TrkA